MRLLSHEECQLTSLILEMVGGPTGEEAFQALRVLNTAPKAEVKAAVESCDPYKILKSTRKLSCPIQHLRLRVSSSTSSSAILFWVAFFVSLAGSLKILELVPGLASTPFLLPLLLRDFDSLCTVTVGDGPASMYYSFNDGEEGNDNFWMDLADHIDAEELLQKLYPEGIPLSELRTWGSLCLLAAKGQTILRQGNL